MPKVKPQRTRSIYCCQACGHTEGKWLGRCPACQEWNSLVEELPTLAAPTPSATGVSDGAAAISLAAVGGSFGRARRQSGIGELDRVLGGGFVAGSMVLLGGDPGVGKSTLLIQALAGLGQPGTAGVPGVAEVASVGGFDKESGRSTAPPNAGPALVAGR